MTRLGHRPSSADLGARGTALSHDIGTHHDYGAPKRAGLWHRPVPLQLVAAGKGLVIAGSILFGTGLLAVVSHNGSHDVCSSGLGQLSQAFSQSASDQCAIDNTIWILGLLSTVLGGVLLLAGLIVQSRSAPPPPRSAPKPPGPDAPWGGPGHLPPVGNIQPGWYPDPSAPAQVRWWDGSRWTEWVRSPP